MSKRTGGDHLSREQFEDGRSEEREFAPVDISERASDSVMSQRKVFVPKSRVGGQANKPFTFGAAPVANASTALQTSSVFGGLKQSSASTNPFQSLATSASAMPASQPATGATGSNTKPTTSREFMHFKALNNKFLRKLEEFSKSAEDGSDWSRLCEMYLDFAKRARARAAEEDRKGQVSSASVPEPGSFRIPSTQAQSQPSSDTPAKPATAEESDGDAEIVDVSLADQSADNSSKMVDSPQAAKAPSAAAAPTGFKFDGVPDGPPSFVFGGKTVQSKDTGHKPSASVGGFVFQPNGAGKLMLDSGNSEEGKDESKPSAPEVEPANSSLPNGPAFTFGANDPSPVKQGTGSLNFTFGKPASSTVTESKQPDLRPAGPPKAAEFKFGQQSQPDTQAPAAKPDAAPQKAPDFSFGRSAGATTGASATPFTFGSSSATSAKPAADTQSSAPKTETPADAKNSAFSFSSNLAAPAKSGFVFGATSASKPSASPSGFTFGSASTGSQSQEKPQDKPQPKPFTFGSSAPPAVASATSQAPKPAFTFSSGLDSAKPAEKPSFTFGAAPGASNPAEKSAATAEDAAVTKPAFTFGSTSTSTGSAFGGSGFSFGKKTEEVSQAMPKFGFQSESKTDAPKFTFGESAAGAASSVFSAKPTVEAKADDEDAEAQEDPQIDDLTQQGPGEENEEAVYEKRAKVLELKDGAFETLGVGSLRVLVDKDSKKSRVIIRADGSGRVVINVALRSALSYTVEHKNCVRALDFASGGEKPRVYFLRVKTTEDAEALAKELERVKS